MRVTCRALVFPLSFVRSTRRAFHVSKFVPPRGHDRAFFRDSDCAIFYRGARCASGESNLCLHGRHDCAYFEGMMRANFFRGRWRAFSGSKLMPLFRGTCRDCLFRCMNRAFLSARDVSFTKANSWLHEMHVRASFFYLFSPKCKKKSHENQKNVF